MKHTQRDVPRVVAAREDQPLSRKVRKYTSLKDRVFFLLGGAERFSMSCVVDVAERFAARASTRRFTHGFFLHSSGSNSNPLSDIQGLLAANPGLAAASGKPFPAVNDLFDLTLLMDALSSGLATPGFLIPTASLGSEWNFDQPTEDQIPIWLEALSIMVAHKVKHSKKPKGSTVHPGSALTLTDLEEEKGDCLTRAALLAAIYRLNGFPARVVGNRLFFPHYHIDKRGTFVLTEYDDRVHAWTEVWFQGKWFKKTLVLL